MSYHLMIVFLVPVCLPFILISWPPPFLFMWAYPIWLPLFTSFHFFCNLFSLSSPFCCCFSLCPSVFYSLLFALPSLFTLSSTLPLFHPTLSPHHTLTPFFLHCFLPLPLSDIRLRVRAEYLEHESALRDGVSSDKQQPLERQFELFSQASLLLRARDLGSIVCDIKFTELENLEAFWGDYLSGALLEALKGVFITDSLRMAAGTEGVRLLISVDQDDYEEGRRLLRARLSSSNGGRTETQWAV